MAEQVQEDRTDVEIGLEQDLYEYLLESKALNGESLAMNPNFEASLAEDLPFGLIIAERSGDTDVCLAVYGEGRTLEGLIFNDTPAAVDWPESVWDRYSDQASLIE